MLRPTFLDLSAVAFLGGSIGRRIADRAWYGQPGIARELAHGLGEREPFGPHGEVNRVATCTAREAAIAVMAD